MRRKIKQGREMGEGLQNLMYPFYIEIPSF